MLTRWQRMSTHRKGVSKLTKILNEKVGNVLYDSLIYDGTHPIDGKNVTVTLPGGTAGTIKRGQVLDLDASKNEYKVHAASGVVNCIVARDVGYTSEEKSVTAEVYLSGPFRQDAVVTDVELTAADVERFRSLGIYLK